MGWHNISDFKRILGIFGLCTTTVMVMSSIPTVGVWQWAYGVNKTQEFQNFTVGGSTLVREQPYGYSIVNDANTIEFYYVSTKVFNNDNSSKTFEYITMVLDNDGVAVDIDEGELEAPPMQEISVGPGYFYWMPEKAGEYVIKIFLWTELENPEPILNLPNIIKITVKDKIAKLSEGERDVGLYVKEINLGDQTVRVGYSGCTAVPIEQEKLLRVGDNVEISSYALAYFLGFDDDGKTVFKYESTGRGPCLLVCHHNDALEAYRFHVQPFSDLAT